MEFYLILENTKAGVFNWGEEFPIKGDFALDVFF